MKSLDLDSQGKIGIIYFIRKLMPGVYRVMPLIFIIGLLTVSLPAAPMPHASAAAPMLESDTELVTAAGCGTERWDVKTLSDADAASIHHSPKMTTVEQLTGLPVPGPLQLHTARYSQERQVYRLTARLLRYKLEKDSDFHIVIAGASGQTMIVESASPNCVRGASPGDLQAIKVARTGFLTILSANSLPTPGSSMRRVTQRIMMMVTGALFFDLLHGQSGVAPNGVELHPILQIAPTH